MQIKHYHMHNGDINYQLLKKLKEKKFYTDDGVLKDVYDFPEESIPEEAYLSVMTHRRSPISMLFISKNEYFGWNDFNTLVKDTYGIIGFYTLPDYRGNGYSKALFEDFDKIHRVRKLSASPRCNGILKSVDKKDLVIIHNA